MIRASGQPIVCTAWNVLLAKINAVGFAKPMSSLAYMINLLQINFGSSPPSIIRASQ